jgi:uncharacterized protein YbjT (DUF2867 family)
LFLLLHFLIKKSMENSKNLSVIVVGATGFLGMEICRQLVASKRKVKGLVRTSSDPSKVQALQEMGVEIVTGDIKDVASLSNAFQDGDAVISTASSTFSRQEGDSIETVDNNGQLNVIEAAKNAGVHQFVFISFNVMSQEFPLQTAKRRVEKQLMESKMNYTILRPTFFMEIWLSPAIGFDFPNSKATIYGEGKNKISWISLKDVAAFAVVSLDNPVAINSVVELGGPDTLSPLEVVKIFEQHTGTTFTVQCVPKEAIEAQKNDAADSLTESFAALMLAYAGGASINMEEPLKSYPIKLTSVKDYAKQVAPGTQ